MSTDSVSTKYVVTKLCRYKKIKEYLTDTDIKYLKKLCAKLLPSEIKGSDEIKPQISKIVEMLIEKKSAIMTAILDSIKNSISSYICNKVDDIVTKKIVCLKKNKN
ncbi:hypothetical protein CsNV_057 [Callinectes sapidus nudivirus]|nr:hypothetical protein CsNV_057 [Callinectes sapidus nudivirus]